MPRHAFEMDHDDPFGSRPDEKPPQGWNDRYWEEVCEKIEKQRPLPGGRPGPGIPDPAPGRRRAARIVHATMIVIAAVSLAVILIDSWRTPAQHPDPSRTLVRVDGSHPPDVAVEWARMHGHASGFVVLQSIDPEISYVLVDPRYDLLEPAGAQPGREVAE